MGYYTRFTITTQPTDSLDPVIDAITEKLDYNPFDGEEVKWYEVKEDIAAISRNFPGVIITVQGEGEEQGDEWVLHAHDGTTDLYEREPWEPPPPTAVMKQAARRARDQAAIK